MSLFSKLFGKKKKKHHHAPENEPVPVPCDECKEEDCEFVTDDCELDSCDEFPSTCEDDD